MSLEQRLAAAEAELAAIKAEMTKKDEWPKIGDKIFFILNNAQTAEGIYDGDSFDIGLKLLGNLFRTEQEVEAELEARKVIAELRQCVGYRPFVPHSYNNFCLDVVLAEPSYVNVGSWVVQNYGWQSIYFESSDAAESAIEKVGRDRILKAARWLAMREV